MIFLFPCCYMLYLINYYLTDIDGHLNELMNCLHLDISLLSDG